MPPSDTTTDNDDDDDDMRRKWDAFVRNERLTQVGSRSEAIDVGGGNVYLVPHEMLGIEAGHECYMCGRVLFDIRIQITLPYYLAPRGKSVVPVFARFIFNNPDHCTAKQIEEFGEALEVRSDSFNWGSYFGDLLLPLVILLSSRY